MSNGLTRRSLLGAAAASLGAAQSPASQRPNLIFFFPDQVRAQELGYNGGRNIQTLTSNRFSTQSVKFTNAISSCPLCTPYRAMLQTGRWPTLSGGVMNFFNTPSTGHSMGDVFSRGGYKTAYIGKWHLAAGRLAGTLKRGRPPTPQKESEFVPPGPARLGELERMRSRLKDMLHESHGRDGMRTSTLPIPTRFIRSMSRTPYLCTARWPTPAMAFALSRSSTTTGM